MPGELNDISVAIGRLEEGMRFLAQQVHTNQETATAEHREVHIIVTAMAESVRIVAAKVEKMEPLTDDYREKRAESRGAARFVNAAYALCGGTVAMVASELVKAYRGIPHP